LSDLAAHGRVVSCRRGRHTFEELGNTLFDGRHTCACTVGSDVANIAQQPLCSRDDIALVSQRLNEDIFVLEQFWVLEQTENLTEESDGLLVELLRVADVCTDDGVKGQAGIAALADLGPVLLRLDGKLATDGVFGLDDVLVDVV